MSELVLVDDFPEGFGGSELVNNTIAKHFKVSKFISSQELKTINEECTYIICNTSLMSDFMVNLIATKANYIILEHDYKFVRSRHPWRYDNCIVPENEVVNKIIYKNAKAVFVQTDDHLDVFKRNNINGNFISLKCSVWNKEELEYLDHLRNKNKTKKSKFCVVESDNWIKNQQGAERWLSDLKLDYDLVKSNNNSKEFLEALSEYAALVFLPVARESCCRLIVEAKCMGLNVVTTPNSGAFQSNWYTLPAGQLVKYLRDQSKRNLKAIGDYL